jgi:POT family proton-dependent oligopeptide transporter
VAAAARSGPKPVGAPTFLGHPRGLAYLAFTEMWERFSYYGMTSLLLLYMVQQLLLPARVGHVAGLGGLRQALEAVFGPLSAQAFASQVFGFYGGLVYLTPILGGWLADRIFGTTRMVVAGVLLMTMGHLLMTMEATFLAALLLLILGSGALKGNIASQVGQLYPSDDEARRSRGYLIFSTGINIGGLLGSLVCGAVAQLYGWHYGFGLAGVLMLAALAVYLSGRRHLPAVLPSRARRERARLSAYDWRALGLLALILLLSVFGMTGWFMAFNAGFLWTSAHVDLSTRLGDVPMAWFVSLDAGMSIAVPVVLLFIWRRLAERGREPGDLAKIALGFAVLGLCMLVFAGGAAVAGSGRTSLAFPLAAFSLTATGFMCAWPVILALVSRRAPASFRASMMGVAYLVAFFASSASGLLAGLYERMAPAHFFVAVALLPAGAAVILFSSRRLLSTALDAAAAPAA